MHNSVTYPILRRMLGYIDDEQFHHKFHLMALGVQVRTLRATSHTSQEPWPYNGEDPWFSSKGHTMGVGKAVLGSHRTSSIVWSENGPCCGPIAYFVGGKRGEDLVSYNMSQTLPIWENYLVVFVNPRIYFGICLEICPAGKNKK